MVRVDDAGVGLVRPSCRGPGQPQATPQAGVHYQLIANAKVPENGEQIVVEAYFFYGCPSCYQFEPHLEPWLRALPDDVKFVRVAPSLNPNWEPLARAFYAGQLLGVEDKVHHAMFDALFVKGFRPSSPEDLADFYAELGVDRDQFLEMFHSFAVSTAVNRANSRARQAGIGGVPSIVVDGRYRVDIEQAGGHAGMLKVTDGLLEQIRAGR